MLTVLAALSLFFLMLAFCNVLGELFDNAIWFFLAIPCTILFMSEAHSYWFSTFGYILISYDFLRVLRYIWIAVSPDDKGGR